MKKLLYFLIFVFLLSCGGPEPRRPVKASGGSFLKTSVERNQQLLAKEEALIQEIIKADSVNEYYTSGDGSWFHYIRQLDDSGEMAAPDDLVTLTYQVMNFDNDTIYSLEEIGILQYKVDKEELFPGLRNGVKLLRKGEIATFLFPSSQGYGYHGDNHKIGTNIPLKTTVEILQIEKSKDSIQN